MESKLSISCEAISPSVRVKVLTLEEKIVAMDKFIDNHWKNNQQVAQKMKEKYTKIITDDHNEKEMINILESEEFKQKVANIAKSTSMKFILDKIVSIGASDEISSDAPIDMKNLFENDIFKSCITDVIRLVAGKKENKL